MKTHGLWQNFAEFRGRDPDENTDILDVDIWIESDGYFHSLCIELDKGETKKRRFANLTTENGYVLKELYLKLKEIFGQLPTNKFEGL